MITAEILPSISDISAEDWDACANPSGIQPASDPFTTHRFLLALEQSGSVGPRTGWQARHILVRKDGSLIGAMPCYAKGHSQGEYIFDHNWAHAYENAGGRYYPKLQAAVPFTPATGRRFLTRCPDDAEAIGALAQGAIQLAEQNQISSLHITFCDEAEHVFGGQIGLQKRIGQQFHWYNNGYSTFDDFLAALSSRKRKNIRKERARAQAFGGRIHRFEGDAIEPEHWDAFWQFYQDTGIRKWGTPYLTRAFFEHAQETLRDDMILIMAERGGQFVAGALNFLSADCLYGRYWGCTEHHDALHFELCYYQAIDIAIERGLDRVEAGAQGAHKLARGYLPAATYSLHWIADPGFRNSVEQYLEAERNAIDEEIEILTDYGPFRKDNGDNDREIE